MTSGSLDTRFGTFESRGSYRIRPATWFRLELPTTARPANTDGSGQVLLVRTGIVEPLIAFGQRAGVSVRLQPALRIPRFGSTRDTAFDLPEDLDWDHPVYIRIGPKSGASADLGFVIEPLDQVIARVRPHAQIIASAAGALATMALTALLVRLVLPDKLYSLYAALFFLQALYLAYFSGLAYEWPLFPHGRIASIYAANVIVALSGSAACLFVREFANLRPASPRAYRIFGWLALAFAVVAVSNGLRPLGLASLVADVGNMLFLGSAIFTVVVSYLAWRRGNRAAGFCLIAWMLLSAFQMATAFYMLYDRDAAAEKLLYQGLAPSMVAAAVLIALGVADRVRQQNIALTEAERRAQTDPLTGVLNRRSLIERLDTASARARSRAQPLSVLFIDLDHFKQINDTHGHAAGDACLAGIIAPIQAELRQTDVIGRYGGEEFVVILSGADAAAARPIAERICARLASIGIAGFGAPIRLTCSIGLASSDTLGVWGQHLIAHADTAQYAAKRSGRNQVQQAAALAA
ncbi:MAG: diguanylate cyclase [Proteobacteria bacterium]|nr:diguanylate cyclase [Pseudomonadota bacterium]